MANWDALVEKLLLAETSDLRELARIANRSPTSFYTDANFRSANLSKNDILDLNLKGRWLARAKYRSERSELAPSERHLLTLLLHEETLNDLDVTTNPADWAAAQGKLGRMLVEIGMDGEDEALHDAVDAFRGALSAYKIENMHLEWAATQNNLGAALKTLGQRGDDAALQDAVTAFRAALEVFTRDALPVDWAATQNNLGGALRILGERGDDTLQDAVAAYRDALEVRTREALPVDWAMTQNNLGNALLTLGQRGDDAALQDAVTAFRAALEVHTRDALPVGWAMTQNNLGNALRTLGERGDDAALQDAVTAYRAALEVYTRDALPVDWAMTRENMALCFVAMAKADPEKAEHHLAEALAAVEDALTIYTPEHTSFLFDKATRLRDHILAAQNAL